MSIYLIWVLKYTLLVTNWDKKYANIAQGRRKSVYILNTIV